MCWRTISANLLAAVTVVVAGCGGGEPRPNVVWIVWDTVRADRMGLYGYARDTTPNLDRWSMSGRVYDCSAVSCWTIPSHASMFTGLFPSEHGVNSLTSRLDDRYETVAEILQGDGYQTYLFSANPFISRNLNLSQGFEIEEHPVDEALVARAQETVLAKIDPADSRNALRAGVRKSRARAWFVKAVGEIANERFLHFVDGREPDRPFFAFLNYMEAHRIRVPPRRFLERVLGTKAVEPAYDFDQSQGRFKRVSLGLEAPFSDAEREWIGAVYDATLLELDELLDRLFEQLRSRGLLDDTIVVLTSDHGEHLGERGSYLHQYSLHEGVLAVPLVIWAPRRLAAGREEVAVSNIDLFSTILELAQVRRRRPAGAADLLRPSAKRPVVAEYPEAYRQLLRNLEEENPDWDSTPFLRQLRSLRLGPHKLVWSSTGPPELYDLSADPGERANLAAALPQRVAELSSLLRDWVAARGRGPDGERPERTLTDKEKERLRSLGYL
jgi:arylsulfatase A-like enzyme